MTYNHHVTARKLHLHRQLVLHLRYAFPRSGSRNPAAALCSMAHIQDGLADDTAPFGYPLLPDGLIEQELLPHLIEVHEQDGLHKYRVTPYGVRVAGELREAT